MNKRCIIVGGGDSLRGFNFWTLKNENVYTVNQMAFFCPHADNYIFWDPIIYKKYKKQLKKLKGQIHTLGHWGFNEPSFQEWRNWGHGHISRIVPFVGNNNMSVLFALNVAIHHGYKEFYLIGCENKLTTDKIHFYDNKPMLARQRANYENAFNTMHGLCVKVKECLLPDEIVVVVGDTTLNMFDNISWDEFNSTL